ncbi:hypothetical protein D1007_54144 [Hordeum vulgare]|nr:hypothetical protein D1007_54144 [Hordeum vulgare]
MTTLLLRGSPSTRRRERKGSPDALQEGLAAPAGATATVSTRPTGISPDLNLHLRRIGPRQQTDHHPEQLGLEASTPAHHSNARRDLHDEEEEPGLGASSPTTRGRAQPPPSRTIMPMSPAEFFDNAT